MAENYFMKEVTYLKEVIQNASRLRNFEEGAVSELISQEIERRIEWAR